MRGADGGGMRARGARVDGVGLFAPAHALLDGRPAGVGVDGLEAGVGGEAEDLLGVFAEAGFDGGEGIVEASEGGGEQEGGGGGEGLAADLFGEFGIEGFGRLAVAFAEFEPGDVGTEDGGVEFGLIQMDGGFVEAL